jgi:hypothetical protein
MKAQNVASRFAGLGKDAIFLGDARSQLEFPGLLASVGHPI